MRRGTTCSTLLIGLLPVIAAAGVSYNVTSRAVPGSGAPAVIQYFVERDEVRVGAADTGRVQLFKDGSIYIIDKFSRSAEVVRNATLARMQQGLAEQVKKMEDMASTAPPDQRATAEKAATMVKEMYERQRDGTPRDFRVTPGRRRRRVGRAGSGKSTSRMSNAPNCASPQRERLLAARRFCRG